MTATAVATEKVQAETSRYDVWIRLAVAIASGAVLYLSFPPREAWWLAPIAFVGLGWSIDDRRARAGFGYGLAFGLTFFLLHLMWIEDFLGRSFGSTPWLALSAVLALFLAAGCAAMTVVARLPAGPVWMAALFVAQEELRSRFPLNGFPWGRPAFSQPDGAYTSLASLGGAPVVSFAVVLTGFAVAHVIRRRKPLVNAVTAVAPILIGLLTWTTIDTAPTAGTRTVGLVQGNAPDIGVDLLNAKDRIRANHLAESAKLQAAIKAHKVARPDFVVWPESATFVRGDDPDLDAMARQFGVPVLVGALDVDGAGKARNAAIVWDPRRGRGAEYTKRELVPFAEYVPWRTIAAWFTPFLDQTQDMVWGSQPGALNVDGTTVGVTICYEAAYDYAAEDAVKAGARLLVVPTNNAWYGPGEMSYQQLAMSRLRAVEHGRAAVVAATSGVSAVVEPDGTVEQSTNLFMAKSLVSRVPLKDDTTLATILGPWPGWLIVAGGVGAVALSIGLRLRGRGKKEQHG